MIAMTRKVGAGSIPKTASCWLPLLIAAGALVITFALWRALDRQDDNFLMRTTELSMARLRASLLEELDSEFKELAALARRWEGPSEPRKDEWEIDAALHLAHYPGYAAVEWVSEKLDTRWKVPAFTGSAALELDDILRERQRELIGMVREPRQVVTLPATQSKQNVKVFVTGIPTFRNNRMTGLLAGVFRPDRLIDSAVDENMNREFSVSVFEQDQPIYKTNEDTVNPWVHETTLTFQGVVWRLKIWPRPWLIEREKSALPEVTLGFGIMIAVVLAMTVHFAQTSRRNAREKEAANRKLAEQNRRVEEATQHKTRFLANISHELRTPLNAIIGFSELIHDGRAGTISAVQKEFVEDILTSARHLLQLINDVLDLSKVEAGKIEFRPQPVRIDRVIAEVRDIVGSLAANKAISIETQIDQEISEIVIDPGRLKQILYNYISNALKFTPEHGKITVRILKEGCSQFRLEVQDTGPGIRPEDMQKLFVEFQQLQHLSGARQQGTGLGLALTKKIVEAQGGRVGVHSTLGEGTTFSATLPCVLRVVDRDYAELVPSVHEPRAAEDQAVWKKAGNGEPLLVVDDHPVNLKLARVLLEEAGFHVETATDAQEALEMLKTYRPVIILTDIQMPRMDGYEFTRRLKADPAIRDIVVVAMTASAMKSDRERVLEAGCDGYITKPIDTKTLPGTIADFIRKRTGAATTDDQRTPAVGLPAVSHGQEAGIEPDGPPREIARFRQAMREAGIEESFPALIDVFLQTAPINRETLKSAVASGDVRTIGRVAHAFKSASGAIGAQTLTSLLFETEIAGRSEDVERAREVFKQVCNEYDLMMPTLRKILKEYGSCKAESLAGIG